MDQRWDDLPNPDEVRKQNYMDAREIKTREKVYEQRIVAAHQKEENQWHGQSQQTAAAEKPF